MSRHKLFAAVAAALAMAASAPSYAITVTLNNNVHDLMNALVAPGSGLNVISATLSGHYDDDNLIGSTGTYTNASGTYGIGNGIVLSTGNVLDYGDGENTQGDRTYRYGIAATAAQEALLDPITGGTYSHFDVTQLDITFTTSTGESTSTWCSAARSIQSMWVPNSTTASGCSSTASTSRRWEAGPSTLAIRM
jgi:hypothetical protein